MLDLKLIIITIDLPRFIELLYSFIVLSVPVVLFNHSFFNERFVHANYLRSASPRARTCYKSVVWEIVLKYIYNNYYNYIYEEQDDPVTWRHYQELI